MSAQAKQTNASQDVVTALQQAIDKQRVLAAEDAAAHSRAHSVRIGHFDNVAVAAKGTLAMSVIALALLVGVSANNLRSPSIVAPDDIVAALTQQYSDVQRYTPYAYSINLLDHRCDARGDEKRCAVRVAITKRGATVLSTTEHAGVVAITGKSSADVPGMRRFHEQSQDAGSFDLATPLFN